MSCVGYNYSSTNLCHLPVIDLLPYNQTAPLHSNDNYHQYENDYQTTHQYALLKTSKSQPIAAFLSRAG